MSPLHIVHVFESLMPGGAERQALLLVRNSDAGRFRHSVINYCPRPGDLTAAFADAGVSVHTLAKSELGPVRFFFALRALLRRLEPDVVHALLYSPSFWGRAAALSVGLRGIVASARNSRPYETWYESFGDRLLSRGTRVRIANSNGVRDVLLGSVGLEDREVRVIYNGIDTRRLTPSAGRTELRRRLGWGDGQIVLLCVGRLVPEKDFPLLLRAAARLRERAPAARVCIAGWGPLQTDLESLRASLRLEGVVDLLGRREDVSDLLAACDVFVMTSRTEGFSNALLEALAAGVPVLSTRVNGAIEILRDEENALLADVGDEDAVVEGLARLAADSALRSRLAAAGAACVRERFTVDAMVRAHEAVYTETAQASRRSG